MVFQAQLLFLLLLSINVSFKNEVGNTFALVKFYIGIGLNHYVRQPFSNFFGSCRLNTYGNFNLCSEGNSLYGFSMTYSMKGLSTISASILRICLRFASFQENRSISFARV